MIFKGSGTVFSAGGDVKGIISSSTGRKPVEEGYRSSSWTYDLLLNYKKPFVVLIDGLAMGGAAIYAMPAKYRVATERTVFAMPETFIGYFNDAGASHFLSRLGNNFGLYMGMTGARVKGFDMVKLGLATHFIESRELEDVEQALIKCKSFSEVERTLSGFSSVPSPVESELDSILTRINKCFGGETVEDIYENLYHDGSDWAQRTVKTLDKMSPMSLKVTHRSISLGRNLSPRDCLKMELRLVVQHVIKSDMQEGVRALLLDKDFKPKWNPRAIGDVTEEQVDRFFQKLPEDEELSFDGDLESKL